MSGWSLESIEVSGGFLAGLRLHLPPGLTCIIGPRGSGKSTLLEAIRYGIGGEAAVCRAGLANKNLSHATITLQTRGAVGQSGYTIRRAHKQPASLVTAAGEAITSVDLERGTFLPLDAYSSDDIEAIADEVLGERRRSLIDDLRNDDLREIRTNLSDRQRGLSANADALRDAERQLANQNESIEELTGARQRLSALPEPPASEVSQSLVEKLHQMKSNQRDSDLLAEKRDLLRRFSTELLELAGLVERELVLEVSSDDTDRDLLARAQDELAGVMKVIADQTSQSNAALSRAAQTMEKLVLELSEAQLRLRTEYAELEAADHAVSTTVRDRRDAEVAVAELEKLETDRESLRLRLAQLKEARQNLKADFLLKRDEIWAIRQEVADALQGDAGSNVRLRVQRSADNSAYKSTLLEALKGAKVRNHDDIIEQLMRFRPEQLSQIVANNDVEELDGQTSLGVERCSRILEAYRLAIDPLELEVVATEDRIDIELNVSTGPEPLFKDASELSQGQKCTALLPLLLARRDTPLIIDQPEDNLDNHFIFETVVESIRRLKSRRQMVFITHNANIPVLAEADLVVVLDSDGRRGTIGAMGSLDECREQIIDLLEGGREAFEMRRQRYAGG